MLQVLVAITYGFGVAGLVALVAGVFVCAAIDERDVKAATGADPAAARHHRRGVHRRSAPVG